MNICQIGFMIFQLYTLSWFKRSKRLRCVVYFMNGRKSSRTSKLHFESSQPQISEKNGIIYFKKSNYRLSNFLSAGDEIRSFFRF